MSFDGLRIGSSGLVAAQRALETTAHNLANVNTEGYSRQRVETSAATSRVYQANLRGAVTVGQGVVVNGITRATDSLLVANLRDQVASQASWGTRAAFAARAEGVLGPLDGGVSSALSTFWNSWNSLSTEPSSISGRFMLAEAGRQLASSLSRAGAYLERLASDNTAELRTITSQANDIAANVASLNQRIAQAGNAGSSTADLQDQRELALRELTALTGARAVTEPSGAVRVTVGAMPLVDGATVTPLAVASSPTRVVWPDGTAAAASGRVGALVEIGAGDIGDLRSRIDAIATGLRDVVNAAHREGFGLDGINGRDFFTGTDAATLAVDPTLTEAMIAASASGAPGDGNHAIAMGALRNTPTTAGGSTVNELFNGLQSLLGLRAGEATREEQTARVIVDELSARLSSVSGVSTDSELVDMLRYQRAFEASARVITVVDQMLDRLINGTGATR